MGVTINNSSLKKIMDQQVGPIVGKIAEAKIRKAAEQAQDGPYRASKSSIKKSFKDKVYPV